MGSSQTSDYYQFRDCAATCDDDIAANHLGLGNERIRTCPSTGKCVAPLATGGTITFTCTPSGWGCPNGKCPVVTPATTKKPVPVTTKKKAQCPFFVARGFVGPNERWLGIEASAASCAAKVMRDSRCAKDYFSYLARSNKNCGCKPKGALKVTSSQTSDYYQFRDCAAPANTCSCANGSPKTGAACTKNGAAMCASCKAGYAISTDKTKCLDVNPCAKNNGGCHTERKCTHSGGKATCGTCSPGWVNVGATSCKRQCYFFVARGLSGPDVTWLGIESSVPKCAAKVLRNPRCTKDYFSYLLRSNKNCGCKTKSGPLKVIASQTSDYYRIGDC